MPALVLRRSAFTTLCIIATLLFLINLYYEMFDFNLEILHMAHVEAATKTLINPYIKQFASEAAFCNLTSSFATDVENKMKQRIYDNILLNQFNCANRSYWVSSMKWDSGLGWQMHEIALALLTAVAQHKVFIWGNNYDEWPFMQSPYCSSMRCYFEPITNCSLPQNAPYTKVRTLHITLEMQTYWNPILGIEHEPKTQFLSRSSYKYTLLVTIAQWYLLRYNERTQSIITSNIEASLNLMHLKEGQRPNPNEMISIPVRHSDKCYNEHYNNAGAEMLCFEAEHIVIIAEQIQFLYQYNNSYAVKYGIVNSEDSNIVQEIIEAPNRSFHVLTNVNDIRPETGDPKNWNKNNHTIAKQKLENDYMTSMLTVAQLSSIPRYWLYIFSSNWFFYLSHFRTILKCYPSNMDKKGDIQIELKSYCRRCPHRSAPGYRDVIYKSLPYSVYEHEFLVALLDIQCVVWREKYYKSSNKYEVLCQLTDRF